MGPRTRDGFPVFSINCVSFPLTPSLDKTIFLLQYLLDYGLPLTASVHWLWASGVVTMLAHCSRCLLDRVVYTMNVSTVINLEGLLLGFIHEDAEARGREVAVQGHRTPCGNLGLGNIC